MITPDNRVPQDDQQDEDKDDQMSQQDIHSNGLDEPDASLIDDNTKDESDALAQAYEAAEPSYTLNLDDDDNTDDDE